MTEREIAKRLREVAKAPTLNIEGRRELTLIADELDPPRPEPGTVVWWRYLGDHKYDWYLGECEDYGIDQFGTNDIAKWSEVEYKPARIAGPRQEIVDIPPVSEWPEKCDSITWVYREPDGALCHYDPIITREEAERREDRDE